MAYDDIKTHKGAGFQPLSRKHIFVKTTGGVGVNLTPPPPTDYLGLSPSTQRRLFLLFNGIFFCFSSLFKVYVR